MGYGLVVVGDNFCFPRTRFELPSIRTGIDVSFQQNWTSALRNCTAIGTTLLAVEYDDKDACLSKLWHSKKDYFVIF
jgi:hypothetical protein